MALVEGCKHELEISIPAEAVEEETSKVTKTFQGKAKLPGFRPGKAPASLIRRNFGGDIRQQVLEHLVPKFFDAKAKEESLRVVGTPNISDVHFHDGEPLRFKAHFEVFPEFEPAEYTGVEIPYRQPEVTSDDVEKRFRNRSSSHPTSAHSSPPSTMDMIAVRKCEGTSKYKYTKPIGKSRISVQSHIISRSGSTLKRQPK